VARDVWRASWESTSRDRGSDGDIRRIPEARGAFDSMAWLDGDYKRCTRNSIVSETFSP
jgi:hypothetical protein